MTCLPCSRTWPWWMSAPPGPPHCCSGSEAKSILFPDPAPEWVPTLSSRPWRIPSAASCTWVLSPELPEPWHPPPTDMPPPGHGALETKWARAEMAWDSHGGRGGGVGREVPTPGLHWLPPNLGPPGRVLLANWRGGLSLCLAASQLLAWCPAISIYVCRWLGLPALLLGTDWRDLGIL